MLSLKHAYGLGSVEGGVGDVDIQPAHHVFPQVCYEAGPIVTGHLGRDPIEADPAVEEGLSGLSGGRFPERKGADETSRSAQAGKQVPIPLTRGKGSHYVDHDMAKPAVRNFKLTCINQF